MKTNKWLWLIAAAMMSLSTTQAQTPPSAPPSAEVATAPSVSPTAAEVVRLAEAGTSDDVMLAYIQNSTSTFDLSADQILYLRDIGLSAPVITAMLSRDNALRNSSQSYTYDQKLYPPSGPAPAVPAPVQTAPPEPVPEPAPVVALATPPTYVSSPPVEVSYFYDNLSPYGTWVQLDGVGWCWQPRVVVINHGWRPYCDSGHWVYTDAGWFWQSDYSWGWAPFHYGRWQLHERCGWVWSPDREWGPAWVTWRSEGDHCGWAPLPPHAEFDFHSGYRYNGLHVALDFDFGLRPEHFTFIALSDFHDHDFAHHRLPPTQVTQIYNHTTVINNYVVNNNTVVNQGIKVDRVAAATHTEIRKVAIRDVPAGSPAVSSPHLGAKTDLAVYRPQLKAPPRPVNMVAQKIDDRHPVIQHPPVVAPSPQRPLVAGSTASLNATRGNVNRPVQSPGSPAVRGSQDRQVAAPAPHLSGAPVYSQPQANPKPYRPPGASTAPTSTATRAPEKSVASSSRPTVETATHPGAVSTQSSATQHYPSPSGQPAAADTHRPGTQGRPMVETPSRPAVVPSQTQPNQQYYPLRTGPPTAADTYRSSPQGQNTHTYYPKGYYQSTQPRPAPPVNARPPEARPVEVRPQPSTAPRQPSSADNGNRSQGGPPSKNNQ